MNNRFTSFGLGLILTLLALPNIALSLPYSYVADSAQDLISIIDLDIANPDPLMNTVPLGKNTSPKNIVVSPSGAEVFVTNTNAGDGEAKVSILDVSTPGTENVYTTIIDDNMVQPEGLALSDDGETLYVAHGTPPPPDSGHTYSWFTELSEIDVSDLDDVVISRSVAFLINDAVSPYEIKMGPTGSKVYISGQLADSIFIVDVATMATEDVEQIYIGDSLAENPDFETNPINYEPYGMAIAHDGSKVVVANALADTVTIIGAGNSITRVGVGVEPHDVVILPDNIHAYVINSGFSAPGDINYVAPSVSVIDLRINEVVDTFENFEGEGSSNAIDPRHISTNEDGSYVFVTGWGDNTVTVIDTEFNTLANTVDLENGLESGGGMLGIAVAPEPFPWLNPDKEAVTFLAELIVGQTTPQNVTITNKGLQNLTIGTIAQNLPENGNFSIPVNTDNCSGAILEYKETCTLTINFTPTVGGELYDSIIIPSDDDLFAGPISISGTGASQSGNNDPYSFALGSPRVGATSVDLTWNKTTDPDRDPVTYRVYITEYGNAFNDGVYHVVDPDLLLAGSGLVSLLLLGGALRNRNRKMFVMASLFAVMALLSACGGGGGGGSGGGGEVQIVKTTIGNLTSNTQYIWEVVADDGKGGTGKSSSTGIFKTL